MCAVLCVRRQAGGVLLHASRDLEPNSCGAIVVSLQLATLHDSSVTPAAPCFTASGCSLHLRVPSWADPATSSITLNGRPLDAGTGRGGGGARLRPGHFVRLQRQWEAGDRVVALFGLYTYVEPLNDWRPQYRDTYALLYGPYMMVRRVRLVRFPTVRLHALATHLDSPVFASLSHRRVPLR